MGVGQVKHNISRGQYHCLILIGGLGDKMELTNGDVRRRYRPLHYRRDTNINRVLNTLLDEGLIEDYYGMTKIGNQRVRPYYKITEKGLILLEAEHLEYCRILSIGD